MFPTTEHDFGTVARNAATRFEFTMENLYLEDVHITGVRSSCGCTTPEIKTPTLKTHQQGAIVARFNTHLFHGAKGATITVTIDKPYPAQVQLHVRGFIRDDVAVTPGSVEFATVDQGTVAEKAVEVSFFGPGDWQILEVRSTNSHLSGRAIKTLATGGHVAYRLVAQLDGETPVGYVDEHLLLVTNTPGTAQIPVVVKGFVQSAVTVSPAVLFLGAVQPGEKVTKQLVVQGKKPFQIVVVRGAGDGFAFDVPADGRSNAVHLIPVTFVAGSTPGQITRTIHIETNLGSPVVSAFAVITPQR
jgi:hypothetical protein